MTILEIALHWLQLGIATIPIQWRSKFPDGTALRLSGDVENGHPVWRRYQTELPTSETLRRWFTGPWRNLAVVTGWSGLVVVDFDSMDAWDSYLALGVASSVAGGTFKVLTGRGVHMYLFCDEQVRNGHCGMIDVKAAGGYVLVPPSIHPSGREYRAVDPGAPILRVPRFADVFPFELQAPDDAPPLATERTVSALQTLSPNGDPWQMAESAAWSDGHLVERIRATVRIEDMFPDAIATGKNYLAARCPFHDDERPSLWIDTARQIAGCHAGCNGRRPWDVINLVSRLRGISNREAVLELARAV